MSFIDQKMACTSFKDCNVTFATWQQPEHVTTHVHFFGELILLCIRMKFDTNWLTHNGCRGRFWSDER